MGHLNVQKTEAFCAKEEKKITRQFLHKTKI